MASPYKHTAIPINYAQLLLATSDSQATNDIADDQVLLEQLQAQFNITEIDDMLFIATPDLPPMPITESTLTVAEQSNTKRELSYGICEIIPPFSKDDRGYFDVHLYPERIAIRFLPKYIQQRIDDNTLDFDLSNLIVDFENQIRVTRLKEPEHGSIQGKSIYQPNEGYIGKDKVDLLIEGNDLDGKAFSVKVKYYINVVPNAYNLNYQEALNKYCGTNKVFWQIVQQELSALPNIDSSGISLARRLSENADEKLSSPNSLSVQFSWKNSKSCYNNLIYLI